jgi:hypothetical protein
MQHVNTTPATVTVTATPAPAPATPAPATPAPATPAKAATPTTGKGATLLPISNPKQAITAAQVHAFVNKAAGGNPANVAIVFIGSKAGANPMPFANMVKQGKRASILWALVNGVPVKGSKPSNTLATYFTYSKGLGASQANPLDLLAALNGGFSTSSKNWGTGYIKLVVTA